MDAGHAAVGGELVEILRRPAQPDLHRPRRVEHPREHRVAERRPVVLAQPVERPARVRMRVDVDEPDRPPPPDGPQDRIGDRMVPPDRERQRARPRRSPRPTPRSRDGSPRCRSGSRKARRRRPRPPCRRSARSRARGCRARPARSSGSPAARTACPPGSPPPRSIGTPVIATSSPEKSGAPGSTMRCGAVRKVGTPTKGAGRAPRLNTRSATRANFGSCIRPPGSSA